MRLIMSQLDNAAINANCIRDFYIYERNKETSDFLKREEDKDVPTTWRIIITPSDNHVFAEYSTEPQAIDAFNMLVNWLIMPPQNILGTTIASNYGYYCFVFPPNKEQTTAS